MRCFKASESKSPTFKHGDCLLPVPHSLFPFNPIFERNLVLVRNASEQERSGIGSSSPFPDYKINEVFSLLNLFVSNDYRICDDAPP